jgi:hypothetical protein
MTLAKNARLDNQKMALSLMVQGLGEGAIDTTFFDRNSPPFVDAVLPTTWEELERDGHVDKIGVSSYRIAASGWLIGMRLTGITDSADYQNRLGRVLAAMKSHVKGRATSAVVPLEQLAAESGESAGWIFNVVESRSSSTGNERTGANWREGARGRLVEIPAGFNMEPVDIVSALTIEHLEKIQELEQRLEAAELDRAQFHCPYCEAPVSTIGDVDYVDHHCIVTYQTFECGYVTGDGLEESPCPYGPNWPALEEFEFRTRHEGRVWVCEIIGKTPRAKRLNLFRQTGLTKEEAEERAKDRAQPQVRPK